MEKDVYLSLDLDFFGGKLPLLVEILEGLSGTPFSLCLNHEDMLDHLAMFPGVRRLVNLDAHSDLQERTGLLPDLPGYPPVNCGNWVGHVPFRTVGAYVWVDNGHGGDCFYATCPFEDPRVTDWSSVSHVLWEDFDLESLGGRIAGAGLSLSPEYLDIGVPDVETAYLSIGDNAFDSLSGMDSDPVALSGLFRQALFLLSRLPEGGGRRVPGRQPGK